MAERFARGLRRLRLAHTAVVPPLLPGGIAVHPGLPAAGCSVAEVADHAGPADTPRAVACRVGAGWLVVELRRPRRAARPGPGGP
jgi:hypothetical protein